MPIIIDLELYFDERISIVADSNSTKPHNSSRDLHLYKINWYTNQKYYCCCCCCCCLI